MPARQVAPPPVVHLVAAMRDAIIRGELFPGQRLVEAELTESFGATRGTVRQGLVVLEAEGLVEREFNRGARVRSISLDQAIEITEARSVLEGLCAAKTAERATREERKALTQLGSQMKAAVDADDVGLYSTITQQLHSSIREYSRHQTLNDMLDRLNYQSVRYHFSVAFLPGRPKQGVKEHQGVIKAVNSGNPAEAERVMREHLASVIDALRRLAALQSGQMVAKP
jgi:DNA-binding GntR family transcriptional regulator